MTTAATPPSTGAARTAKRTVSKPPPAGHTTSGATPQGAARQTSLEQHLSTVAEADVMSPQGLYEFLEAMRSISSGLAFFTHAAAAQLESAARKGARDAADGRLTLAQKVKLQVLLRRIGKRLNSGVSEDFLAAATNAVKTYALMEEFLEEIESDSVQRPHRTTRGGFSLGGH